MVDGSPKEKRKATDTPPQTREIPKASDRGASISPKSYKRISQLVNPLDSSTMSEGDRNAYQISKLTKKVFSPSRLGVSSDIHMSEAASSPGQTLDTHTFTSENEQTEQAYIANEMARLKKIMENEIKTIERDIKADKDIFQNHVKTIFPQLFSSNEADTADPIVEEAKIEATSMLNEEISRRCRIGDIIVSIEKNRLLNNNMFNKASREILNMGGSPINEDVITPASITRMAVYEPAGRNASEILELHAELEALGEKDFEQSIIDFDDNFIYFLQSENIYGEDERTAELLGNNLTILEETRSQIYSKYEIYRRYISRDQIRYQSIDEDSDHESSGYEDDENELSESEEDVARSKRERSISPPREGSASSKTRNDLSRHQKKKPRTN